MTWTHRKEYIKCGKPNCRSCPHGPYWYAYRRQNGKLRKTYIGKTAPDTRLEAAPANPAWDAIFNKRTASEHLAATILGIRWHAPWPLIHARYKRLAVANHPDKGGNTRTMQQINAAYTYLKCMS